MPYKIKPKYNSSRMRRKKFYRRVLGYLPADWRLCPEITLNSLEELGRALTRIYQKTIF